MSREIRKEQNFWGQEIETIYEDGKKVGEIRKEETLFGLGPTVERTYNTDGEHVSETRKEETLFGLGPTVKRTYNTDGERVSETRREETLFGFGPTVKREYDTDSSQRDSSNRSHNSLSKYASYGSSSSSNTSSFQGSSSSYSSPSNRTASSSSGPAIFGAVGFLIVLGIVAVFMYNALSPTPASHPKVATRPLNIMPPNQFVKDYWRMVETGQYEKSWAHLDPNFQRRNHTNQYSNYVGDWQKRNLCSVSTENIRIAQQTNESAIVSAQLVFRAGRTCRVSKQEFDFHLGVNPPRTTWLISAVKLK